MMLRCRTSPSSGGAYLEVGFYLFQLKEHRDGEGLDDSQFLRDENCPECRLRKMGKATSMTTERRLAISTDWKMESDDSEIYGDNQKLLVALIL
ncbi:hypothetical protein Csa_015363 [Cucumis sativus]|uniref:Uncharacterized protein n=1 Tax=Cucumis sativus TaxID=3659 RepID=A0A0A0KUT2_CUCSA|nr:hypothetical protein Csa_015363 [Cucumis sativus]